MSTIRKVGVVGAGTMGNGIAQACAVSGIDVVMVDVAEAAVLRGLATVTASLDRLLKKEKITAADKDAALKRIHGTTTYDALKGCDLVIEAATENEELKVKILKQVDALARPDVILATNTSSISITKLAAATSRPGKLHRHALLQPGADDDAGRADPRPADRRTRRSPPSRRWRSGSARRRSSSGTAPGSSSTGFCAR